MSRILCVGNAAADVIARTVDEYPPAGGMREFSSLTLSPGGCAVNVAMALARMGLEVDVIVRLADDLLGRFLFDRARDSGVGVNAIRVVSEGSSPFTFVAVGRDGERSFLHHPGTNRLISPADVDRPLLRKARFLVLTGGMTLPHLQGEQGAGLLAEARAMGVTTVMETVYVDQSDEWRQAIDPCLPHLDYFAPSLPEAAALAGSDDPAIAAQTLASRGACNVVIKLSERGAFVRDQAGHIETVPAMSVDDVVDATGAGNSFLAGLVAGLHRGWSLVQAARLGNAVAAQCVVAPGATEGVRPLGETLRLLDAGD